MFKMSNKEITPHHLDCKDFPDPELFLFDSPSKYFRRWQKKKQGLCVLMLSMIRILWKESAFWTAPGSRPTAGGLCLDKGCFVLLILVQVISTGESELREHRASEWHKQQLQKLDSSCLLWYIWWRPSYSKNRSSAYENNSNLILGWVMKMRLNIQESSTQKASQERRSREP